MESNYIFNELERNGALFGDLLSGLPAHQNTWRPAEGKWCLLEICCHLLDEEREDFKARTRHVLETPDKDLPKFDPIKWVTERKYIEQDYDTVLLNFRKEREASVKWLRALMNPQWENAFHHPKFGDMSSKLFLTNWLAHDYLHIRQVMALKFQYLGQVYKQPLNYAGDW